jgi:hypothetical protein
MITGLRSEPELRQRQVEFVIARLAMRDHILANAVRALYTFEQPESDQERANAIASLELSLREADDPGKVAAFAADHPELLPVSMR